MSIPLPSEPTPAPQATSRSAGSRTAAYLVAGALGTIPGWFVLAAFLGVYVATGGVVAAWTIGLVWLVKRRQEDPAWDHRPIHGPVDGSR